MWCHCRVFEVFVRYVTVTKLNDLDFDYSCPTSTLVPIDLAFFALDLSRGWSQSAWSESTSTDGMVLPRLPVHMGFLPTLRIWKQVHLWRKRTARFQTYCVA